MELALDIFRTDEFRATSITEMVGDIDTVPTMLDEMGIYQDVYLRTTTVTLHNKNNNLVRIATSERGAPEQLKGRGTFGARQLSGPRLAQRDRINAKEVENLLNPVLPIGMRMETAMELVMERMAEMKDDDANTREHHRFGGLQGRIMDADGTTEVANFYDEFGITPPAVLNFAFATLTEADLSNFIDTNIVIPMRKALKGRWTPNTEIHALAGTAFWQSLTKHPAVRQLYILVESKVEWLGKSKYRGTIEFGGVIWHHFIGSDDEALQVPTNDAIVFPIGAKDTFTAYHFPGESIDEVNAVARDSYSIISPDYRPNMNEWVDLYHRSYVLYACLCPQALMTVRRTSG